MGHMTCGSCGSTNLMDLKDMEPAIVETLRDHPDTQTAWVNSRTLAERGHKLGLDKLVAILDEQERVEPETLTDFYWSWITTLGIARAIASVARKTVDGEQA